MGASSSDDGLRAWAVALDPVTGVRHEAAFIGAEGSRLFVSRMVGPQPPATGLVICSPVQAELARNYRREVELSRALARQGVAVQRFHYRGAGHSDDHDLTLHSMREDAVSVAHHLVRTTGVTRLAFLGTRLSAFAAAAGAAGFERSPVVLWDPVVEATRYLRQALRARLMANMMSGATTQVTTDSLLAEIRDRGWTAVLGYSLTRQFCDSLEGSELSVEMGRRPRDVLVIQFSRSSVLRSEYVELQQRCSADGPEVEAAVVSEDEPWWLDPLPGRTDTGFVNPELIDSTAAWLVSHLTPMGATK